jgi:hypothetical protein
MEMTLYRGIAVDRQSLSMVLETIQQFGISGDEGWWNFKLPDILKVRKQIKALWKLTSGDEIIGSIFNDTPFRGICACGDETGGRYYALKHNRKLDKTEPILIVFKAKIDDVYVDARDFLCTAFQLWDRTSSDKKKQQSKILEELFGPQVLRYFEAACRTKEERYRIAMCNLASFDPEVVISHYHNQRVIRGRYGTTFCSAFFVKCPVKPSQIVDCVHLKDTAWQDPDPYVTIQNFVSENL